MAAVARRARSWVEFVDRFVPVALHRGDPIVRRRARVIVFNTAILVSYGLVRASLELSLEPLEQSWQMSGASAYLVVDSATGELDRPSGLEIDGSDLWITDNANGRVSVFNADTGVRDRYYETNIPGLGGITKGPDGKMYIADMANNRVLRLEPTGTP